ncbi:hypothetical protein [Anditalea andensis]|uniref:Uncharacterized protein n=1 Tax=Anditalea andensis TaxID=1048983 RepID=A0A074L6Y1_9BACT|nr:hypothetical protein [Anditalea andensis]KEO75573.1 hypothetical protein EL17_00325 [Anditalea andensis]
MTISIIGCQYFDDYQVLKWHLDRFKIMQITTCGENKLDDLVVRYCSENRIHLINRWPGRKQGWFYLCKEYFKLVKSCDLLMAFWYGDSANILGIINKGKKMGKEVMVIRGYHRDKNPL